jgi:phospholipase C
MKHLGLLFSVGLLAACSSQSDSSDPADDGNGVASAWDAESVDHESKSTHLWIVNRGIDILSKHQDLPAAKKAVALLNDQACRTQWQQGLLDADFKAVYNNGEHDLPLGASDLQVGLSKATWKSHFYDPDTDKNYKGETSPTARTEAKSHLARAMENHLGQASASSTACYELGLTLHYYTDLTQPMHASNFTAVDRPAKLHSNLEGYSMEIQARYPLADWAGEPTNVTIDQYVVTTAKDSKAQFALGAQAVINAYNRNEYKDGIWCRNIAAPSWRFLERQHLDYKQCWAGDEEVDRMVGQTLQMAQEHTAKFIYLMASQIPDAAPAPAPQDPPADPPPDQP